MKYELAAMTTITTKHVQQTDVHICTRQMDEPLRDQQV